MYEIIKPLRPYFFSLREIKGNVSLDLKLPSKWKYEEIVSVYKTLKIKVQDKNDKDVLISFICESSQDGYNTGLQCGNEVVEKNIEDEKKRELFDKKVREMRALFEESKLDDLENLKFESNVQEYDTQRIRLVGEGDSKGSVGSGDTQEKNDSTTDEDEEGGSIQSPWK